MKTLGIVSVSALALLLTGGCNPVVKPFVDNSGDFIEIGGIKFRKKGSTNTDILYAGVRREGLVDSFDPKFLPVLSKEIKARQVTRAFNKETEKLALASAVKAGISLSQDSAAASAGSISKVSGSYSVFTLFDVNDFVAELNSDANRDNLNLLKRYEAPRIITSIATVFGHESSSKLGASGRLSLNVKNPMAGAPAFDIKSEASGESVTTLSNGTIFAFEYARICWEKADGKVRIATIEVDRPGFDNNCPSGTDENASAL